MRILTTGFAAAAILLGTSALTTPAFATGYNPPNNNNGCNSHCGDTTTNNNYDNDTYNKGGTGVGVGIGPNTTIPAWSLVKAARLEIEPCSTK